MMRLGLAIHLVEADGKVVVGCRNEGAGLEGGQGHSELKEVEGGSQGVSGCARGSLCLSGYSFF